MPTCEFGNRPYILGENSLRLQIPKYAGSRNPFTVWYLGPIIKAFGYMTLWDALGLWGLGSRVWVVGVLSLVLDISTLHLL